MAYDEKLAQRIRAVLDDRTDVEEKKMFGGIAFMVAGSMACGIVGDELMARVGPERYEDALSLPNTRPMDFTGRPLRGMLYVATPGIRTEAMLRKWVDATVVFALSARTKKKSGRSPASKSPKRKAGRR